MTTATPAPAHRLDALDAFRGAVMLLMASSGLGLSQIARSHPENPLWSWIGRQVDHVPWTGCVLWDLIQPAFMFMVGVALPWSIGNRLARGQSRASLGFHALKRSVVLVLLAVFLTSAWSKRTEWIFPNVLAQIGLGYPLLFGLALLRPHTQLAACTVLLSTYWLAFACHPLPPPGFDFSKVGIDSAWPHLQGFAAHWDKNTNFAAWFDQWFLNLFPRETPFVFNTGGYQTLNFLPSVATMAGGLLTGQLVRSEASLNSKLFKLTGWGLASIALGLVLDLTGVCPIVKRIWTPSWVLYSGGWVTILLVGFVAVIEGKGWKSWAYPLIVAGLNPITLYCLWQLSGGFVRENLKRHLGPGLFEVFGTAWAPALERGSVLLVYWLILNAMFRNRIFIRI